jgi:2-keto-3-deoxy-L-rhamnonate aldolase RhmA
MAVEKLRAGKRIVGTMVRMVRNPGLAQIAKHAGLDFIMLDMEHGTYSIETFADMAKVAKSIGLGIFVRVPELSKGYVSRLMDAGADGIMVPMVSTEEEARKLVAWSRFAPVGGRGFGSSAVYNSFGSLKGDALSFMQEQNKNTIAIAQIETKEAIENIDRIAAVEGIDVLLIGPNDLAISLGVPGDTTGKVNQEAIGKVAAAAKKHNKVFALHAGGALMDKWIPEGNMQMVMNDLDINILKSGFSAIAEKYKA